MASISSKLETEPNLLELKAKLQDGKAVLGTASTVKRLQAGTLGKIFLASNCPDTIKKEIRHLAGLSQIQIAELGLDNEELGVFCKKNFFVSVLCTID